MANMLMKTSTGEPYQPVRVYYDVPKPKTVIGAFKKIKCVEFDPDDNRWVWLFNHEARKLRFQKKHHEIPKQNHPIVLGAFRFPSDARMTFDVRSHDRLVEGVSFFDRRINRRAAKATKMRIVNPIFQVANREEGQRLLEKSFDDWFEREDIQPPASARILAHMDALMTQYPEGLPEKVRAVEVTKLMDQLSAERTPDVEELSVNFYEDGFDALRMALNLRQIEAWRRLQGEDVNQMQIIQEALDRGIFDDIEDE